MLDFGYWRPYESFMSMIWLIELLITILRIVHVFQCRDVGDVCRTGLGLCGELGNRRARVSVQRRLIASVFSVQMSFVDPS